MQPVRYYRKRLLLWHQKRMLLLTLTFFVLTFLACFNWAGWHTINVAKATTSVETIDAEIAEMEQQQTSTAQNNSSSMVLNQQGKPIQPATPEAPEETAASVKDWLELFSSFGQLIAVVFFATVGFVFGTIAEKKHYASIKRREQYFQKMPAVPIRLHHFLSKQQVQYVEETRLVTGCVVVTQDYFKMILANLKNFFGGNVSAYESLMDRARREAILRMKEQAPLADAIVNVRMESLTMGKEENSKNPICSIQVLAYGTAVTLKQP